MRRLGLAAIVVFALARSAFALDIIGGASSVTTANVTGSLAGDVSGTLTNNLVNQLHLNATTVSGVATYAMVATDVIVACDATGQAGGVAVTLQQNLGGTVTPDTFLIKTDSTTNCCSIAPFSGDTLNGGSTAISICGQGEAVKLFPTSVSTWMGQEQSTSGVQTVVAASGATNWANSGSTYMLMGSALAVAGTETALPIPWSRAGLWRNLYCKVSAGALTSTMTFTVSPKSCTPSSGTCSTSDAGFSCQIASGTNGGLLCSDTTHTLITAAGDLVDLAATAANTPTAQPGRCTIQFFPF